MLSLSNNNPNLKMPLPYLPISLDCPPSRMAGLPYITQLHLRQRQLLQGARAWPVCDLIPIYIYYQTHHLSSCVFWQDWNDSDLRLKLCQILNFSIRYTFDSYSTRFNLVRFLTLILISSTFDSFSIGKYSYRKKILQWMASYDNESNARFGFPMSNLTDSLILILYI